MIWFFCFFCWACVCWCVFHDNCILSLYCSVYVFGAFQVSRVCGAHLEFCDFVLKHKCRTVLHERVLAALTQERDKLAEAWRVLHVTAPTSTNQSLRYAREGQSRTREQVVGAVKVVYLHSMGDADTSIIRALEQFMSAAGLSYVSCVHDKVFRAYLHHGGEAGGEVSESALIEMCVRRFVNGEGNGEGMDGGVADGSLSALAALGA